MPDDNRQPRNSDIFRIAVITDSHANLPALRASIEAIQTDGYNMIFHTGDAIGLGPCPVECLELLIETPHTYCLVGNHENWLIRGLPSPRPHWMNGEVLQHLLWTQNQIDPALRSEVEKWPYELMNDFNGTKSHFIHYPLDPSGIEFLPVDEKPTSDDLDRVFDRNPAAIILFGHYHHPVDETGQRRYINPGSLGLHENALARYSFIDFKNGRYTIQHREIQYDDRKLFAYYENRDVPGSNFICKTFFGKGFERYKSGY